jgi:hypothetical protein
VRLRGVQANDVRWPCLEGKYIAYLHFRKEWWAYRRSYHAHVRDELGTLHVEGEMLDPRRKVHGWRYKRT